MRRRALLLGMTLVLAGASTTAFAAEPGDLDTSFGNQGHADFESGNLQSAKRIVATADGSLFVLDDNAVIRLDADGSPSATFGASGRVTLPTAGFRWAGLAVDGVGRVLVAGSEESGPVDGKTALLRLLPSGFPDSSFGGDGVVSVDLGPDDNEIAMSVAIDGSGDYVLAGNVLPKGTDSNLPAVVRLHPDGTPDTALAGTGSRVYTTLTDDFVRHVRIDGDAILLGGQHEADGFENVVARVTRAGDLDGAFGSGGVARTGPATDARNGPLSMDFVVLPDHRVRIAATTGTTPAVSGELVGLTATGAPDPDVGPGGRRTDLVPSKGGTLLTSIAAGADGSLHVGGAVFKDNGQGGTTLSSLLGRLSADGAPDPRFSGDGFTTDGGPLPGIGLGLAVDPSGRPVTLAWILASADPPQTRTRVARFVPVPPPVIPPPPAAPTPDPSVTTPTPPAPTPPTPAPPTPTPRAPAPLVKSASVLKLPSSKSCVSRRTVKLTVAVPKGLKLTGLKAKIGSGKTKTVKSGALLSLKGRPKGKVKVTVTATLSTGQRLTRTVTYRLCAAKATKRKKQ